MNRLQRLLSVSSDLRNFHEVKVVFIIALYQLQNWSWKHMCISWLCTATWLRRPLCNTWPLGIIVRWIMHSPNMQGFFMRTAKPLIRLGGCPGWSESSLGAQPLCWFCRAAAHMTWYSYKKDCTLRSARYGQTASNVHFIRISCHMSRSTTKPTKWLCAQRRLRSALASAQSDQSLRRALSG